jgi:hypothetical protein
MVAVYDCAQHESAREHQGASSVSNTIARRQQFTGMSWLRPSQPISNKEWNSKNQVSNLVTHKIKLQEKWIAKAYSLEALAIATGLTIAEIDAAARGGPVHQHHVERIEHSLR